MLRTPKPTFFCDELSNCYASPCQETEEKDASMLSKEKKEKAYEWYTKDHLSIRQIAHRLGVSKSTAHDWIKEVERKKKQENDAFYRLLLQFGQIEKN